MVQKISTTLDKHERKFELSLTISQTEKLYSEANQALISPIANKIFGFPWTDHVVVGPNFVTIKKQDWVDWSILEEPLKGLITEHFSELDASAVEENPEPTQPAEAKGDKSLNTPEAQTIQKLIEEHINPALANHNGYVVLHGIEGSRVYLEMGGGCQGCAMSYQTLKEGIEGAIKEVVPSIETIIDVTRHEEGENPFYAR